MKVRELIEQLVAEDQEAEVHVAYEYGDHWHTTVAPKLRRIEETPITYSDYHRMPKVVDEDDDDGSYNTAVVLFTTAR
jgi:hypothetical protein